MKKMVLSQGLGKAMFCMIKQGIQTERDLDLSTLKTWDQAVFAMVRILASSGNSVWGLHMATVYAKLNPCSACISLIYITTYISVATLGGKTRIKANNNMNEYTVKNSNNDSLMRPEDKLSQAIQSQSC